MATTIQQKARQSLYNRRKALHDKNLPEIHTYVIKTINDYVEERREDCLRHIGNFEKAINESGGAAAKRKAQAGKKLYEGIEACLDGLKELGPVLAKVSKDKTGVRENFKKSIGTRN